MTLLGLLRFFKCFGSLGEISAGVLPIPIEEQAVKPPIQVIVVRDVPPSTRSRVELIDRARNPRSCLPKPSDQGLVGIGPEIGEEHGEHVVDRAAEWDKATIHISLPDRQLGVQYQPPDCTPVAQHDAGLWPWSPRIDLRSTVRPAHRQPANSDEPPQEHIERRLHHSHPCRAIAKT